MTPIAATTATPAIAPAPAARAQSPVRNSRAEAAPSFEAVRQGVEAVKPNTQDIATHDADTASADAAAAPSLPEPLAIPLLATLPQFAAPTVGTAAPAPTLKSAGATSISASASTSIFFQDADTTETDATDFAADLLAALNTTTAVPVADLKGSAKVDAPVQTDTLPKLDVTNDAWLDQLARDITATASNDGKLSFRIVPPQLGRLDINIETRDAGVAVHMKAETREAQSILSAAQPRLESALGQNGIRVAEASVAQNGQENLPKPHFIAQKALIEAVTDSEPEADTPTPGRAAGRFA